MSLTTRRCDIPSTSWITVNPDFEKGTCTYHIKDQSGKVIWSGFICFDSRTGAMDHTVNTFNPDIMIVRQLAYMGNQIEESFAQKMDADGLSVLCDAVERERTLR